METPLCRPHDTAERLAYEVLGVMSPEFQYPAREFELWTPLYIRPINLENEGTIAICVARLKPDVTLDQARAHMRVLAANLERGYPQAIRGRDVR